jgi:hypothetical protein
VGGISQRCQHLSAHTASQIVSVVTVLPSDPAAVIVALAVIAKAFNRPIESSVR